MKKNRLYALLSIVVFLLLAVWTISCVKEYCDVFNRNTDKYYEMTERCQNADVSVSEETCNYLKSQDPPVMPDTVTLFFQFLLDLDLCQIQYIAPFIIFILAAFSACHDYNTGFYINKLTRISYFQCLKEAFFRACKSVWVIIAWLIFVFIIAYLVSGHFNYNLTLSYYTVNGIPDLAEYIHNYWWFIFIFIFNLICNLMFYVNLALLPIKKSRNYIISVISSYLIFLFCDVFFELFMGGFVFKRIFGISHVSDLMNLFNFWVYDSIPNLPLYCLYCFSLFIGSLLVLYFVYRKKEEVIISGEK